MQPDTPKLKTLRLAASDSAGLTFKTQIAAAFGTLGIAPTPSKRHSVQHKANDVAWLLPAEQDGMKPEQILADYESGKLDPRHGFAEAMLGLKNYEAIMKALKRGHTHRLEQIECSATGQRWQLTRGDELDGITILSHADLAIAAALTSHGCPLLRIEDAGKTSVLHFGDCKNIPAHRIDPRTVATALQVEGLGPEGVPNWPPDHLMPIAMRWQIAAVVHYRQCKRMLEQTGTMIHQTDTKFQGLGRYAIHHENIPGRDHDMIRNFYRRSRR